MNENNNFLYTPTTNEKTPDELIERKKVVCKKVKQPSKDSIFIRYINGQIVKSNRKYRGKN